MFLGFPHHPHGAGVGKHLSGIAAPDLGPDEGSIFHPATERGNDFPLFAPVTL